MTLPAIQAHAGRRPVILHPSEILPGDQMRDLGRLRQVESVEAAGDQIISGSRIRFTETVDGQYGTLTVPGGVAVTVWRRSARPA